MFSEIFLSGSKHLPEVISHLVDTVFSCTVSKLDCSFSFKNKNGEEFNLPVKIEKLTSEELENEFNISDKNREDYKIEIFIVNEGLLQNLFQNEEETSEVVQYKKHLERFITPGMYQENKSLSNVVKLETGQYVTVLADGTIISN